MKRALLPFLSALVVVGAGGVMLAKPAHAADHSFGVGIFSDTVDASIGDGHCKDSAGHCSLRAAVQEANALGGSTNITLVTAGTYTLSIRGADEDNSAAGDIDFRSSINLYAPPGSGNATVTGAAGFGDRLFDIPAGTLSTNVTFEPRLILKGGTAPTGEDGGAIRSVGTGYLFLNQMTISNSSARSGGGVYATGGVGTKLDSNIPVLSGNTATSNGGGIDVEGQGTANFLRVSATGNSAGLPWV